MTMQKIFHHLFAAGLCAALALPGCMVEGTPNAVRQPPELPPAAAPYMPAMPAAQSRKLTILHTNDEHSHLVGFGADHDYPFLTNADGSIDALRTGAIAQTIAQQAALGATVERPITVGGLVRRDYLINKIRSASPDPVLVVSAGDSTMGTLFHVTGDQAAPDFLGQALVGYDFVTMGNHEFDFGADYYADSLSVANNLSFGGAVQVVATNLHFPAGLAEGMPGYRLKSLMGPGNSGATIVPWTTKLLANGLRVGFIGLLGYRAALVAPNKSPAYFSVPRDGADCSATACASPLEQCIDGRCVDPLDAEGHVMAMVAEAQAAVDLLRQQEMVDIVVAISHAGVSPVAALSEDDALARYTTGIDIIIGGHSHDVVYPPRVVESMVHGQTIIAQAGNYGVALGQLTVDIAPSGSVSLDDGATATLLHPIDERLDLEIFGDTNLLVNPPQLSTTFERALTLTGGVLGPVIGGLNDLLVPVLNATLLAPTGKSITSVFASTYADNSLLVQSDHDIVGELPHQDSPLSQLVTDAEWGTVGSKGCFLDLDGPGAYEPFGGNALFVVGVQANGVIRESLRFGLNGSTTVDDIFRVLPLGASPFYTAAPGYPLVAFQLNLVHLFAGIDIGVTQGLLSDDFFLSYSGMRVEYDPTLAPFSPATFNPTSPAPQGAVRRIQISNGVGGWITIFHQDPADTTTPWALRWSAPVTNPGTDTALVITNLYLAGFLEAFQLTPLDPYTGGAITPSATAGVPGSLRRLAKTILCNVAASTDCMATTPAPSIAPCVAVTGGDVPVSGTWPAPEVKEWAVLLGFLTNPAPALNGAIPDCAYELDETNCGPFSARVKPYTP